MNKLIALAMLLLLGATEASAQDAGGMSGDGKIYVVAAVICTIFVGVIIYLIVLDTKIRRLEKQKENGKHQ